MLVGELIYGGLQVPICVGEELASLHEINLREELEHLSGHLVFFKLFSLYLFLFIKFLALFLSELRRKLLVSLVAQDSLPRVLFLHQLVLNVCFSLKLFFMIVDSYLALRRNFTLISLCEGILSFDQLIKVLVLTLNFFNLTECLYFSEFCLRDRLGTVFALRK